MARKPTQRACATGSSNAASASSPPLLWAITSAGAESANICARSLAALADTDSAVRSFTTDVTAP